MILRSPTKDEKGGPFTRFPATRHSRAGGNPGFFPPPIAWLPAGVYPEQQRRRAGMTERCGYSEYSGYFIAYLPTRIFEGGPEAHKLEVEIIPTFVFAGRANFPAIVSTASIK